MWSPSVLTGTLVPVWVGPPSSDHCVDATPESASVALNVTVTFVLFHAGGAVAFVTGLVRSMFTAGVLVALVELPARSLTEALAVRPVPSPEIVLFAGQLVPTPETASVQVQWIDTSPLYQPAPLALVAGAPERAGAVLSMLMFDTVAEPVLPTLSVAVPVANWPAPSEVRVVETGLQL